MKTVRKRVSLRDMQKGKLYRAERQHSAFRHVRVSDWENSAKEFDDGSKPMTIQETIAYVNRVQNSRWFINRFGRKTIRVRDGRGTTIARSYGGEINIPRWARHPMVILHEMAHEANPYRPAHGREYAKVFLALVTRFVGKEAGAELRELFRENRVKFVTSKIKV
jgi:putative metallohydrolase (TIGR04338 family)